MRRKSDWQAKRFGANPPGPVVDLMSQTGLAVLNACGVPVSLATDADGTSQRESWRRFVMGSVEPTANIVAQELSRKLETQVSFDFSPLWAHDIAGRAQAFQKLIAGGMPVAEARPSFPGWQWSRNLVT